MSIDPNAKLAHIRYLINGDLNQSGYGSLIEAFQDLDAHLSAGGTPPEAWREGPDAPADSGPWGWQGDPRADEQDRDEPRPAPEGLAVFAHWSAVHDGVNVEMDVPDGLRVTVHYNDQCVVDQQVRADGVVGYNFLEGSATRLAPGDL